LRPCCCCMARPWEKSNRFVDEISISDSVRIFSCFRPRPTPCSRSDSSSSLNKTQDSKSSTKLVRQYIDSLCNYSGTMIIPSGIHTHSQHRHPCVASRTCILTYKKRFVAENGVRHSVLCGVIEKKNVPPVVAVMVPVSLGQNCAMRRKEWLTVSSTVGRQMFHQERRKKKPKHAKDNGSTRWTTYTLGKFRSLIGCHSTKYCNNLKS
jgi:hypothetical protein